MEANQKLAKIRRMASSGILNALKKITDESEKELMITVLKQRKVEIPIEALTTKEIKIEKVQGIVEKNVVKKPIEKQEIEKVSTKNQKQRQKDTISDYDFKEKDEVLFVPFRTKTATIGVLKSIYQCKRTGYVYVAISFLGKTVYKRANTIKKA